MSMMDFVKPVVLFLSITPVYADYDAEIATITEVVKAIDKVTNNQDIIWPGFVVTGLDSIHFYETHHTYALNRPPAEITWQELIINNNIVYYYDNDSITIPGPGWGMWEHNYEYYMPPKDSEYYSTSVASIISIGFFDFIVEHWWPLNIRPVYSGYNNIKNVKLTFLEKNALESYLAGSGPQAKEALQDAEAIRQVRDQLLDASSLAHEHLMEFYGIATYVGLKTTGQVLNLPNCNLVGWWGFQGQNIDDPSLPVEEILLTMTYNAHFMGTVYSFALDEKSTEWKSYANELLKSPSEILQIYSPMSSAEAADRVREIIQNQRYEYDKIDRTVDRLLTPYFTQRSALEDVYKNLPGIEFETTSKGWNFSPKNFDQIFFIHSQSQVMTNVSYTYNKPNNTSIKYHLENIPVLYRAEHYEGNNVPQFITKFKINSETKLLIDDEETTAKAFIDAHKSKYFHNLSIKSTQMSLDLINVKNGMLDGRNGVLKLLAELDKPISKMEYQSAVKTNVFSYSRLFAHKLG